jgi:hypothetical protein
LSRFGALSIDDRGSWTSFPALALARGNIECVVDALQLSVPIPQHEVRMRRALRRQRLPLATGREHGEDCVGNLANVHLTPTAAALGRRDHRVEQRPFGIRQIARISQTTPLSGAAMLSTSRRRQSTIRVPHNESQAIHPTQQLSGSALTNEISGLKVHRMLAASKRRIGGEPDEMGRPSEGTTDFV